jgi:hypothetical protein
MDLVVAEQAAGQAGHMLGRFVARHPDQALAGRVRDSTKELFDTEVDRGFKEQQCRQDKRTSRSSQLTPSG